MTNKSEEMYSITYIISNDSKSEAHKLALKRLYSEYKDIADVKLVSSGKQIKSYNSDKTEFFIGKINHKYEVKFKIKIKDVRYEKCFEISTDDENKITDLVTARCKKEFSNIKSINCIEYRKISDDETVKEYSKEIKNITTKESSELKDKSDDTDIIDKLLNNKEIKVRRIAKIPKYQLLSDKDNGLDLNFSNLTASVDKNKKLIAISPTNPLVNLNEYQHYLFNIRYKDGTNYGNIDILSSSPSNAVVFFLQLDKAGLDNKIQSDYLKKNSVSYSIMEVKTGKSNVFPKGLIDKMLA